MARRSLVDIDNKIIQAVIKIGAKEGVKNVTATKVAGICDISPFTCFEHFETKRGMLDKSAQYLHLCYMQMLDKWQAEGKNASEVWDEMFDIFIEDADEALFYNEYIMEFGFDPKTRDERRGKFLNVSKNCMKNNKADRTDEQYLMLWDYLMSMAFFYSEKIIHHCLPNNQETKDYIKNIVFYGLENS